MEKRRTEQKHISASAESIWEVLMDFNCYPDVFSQIARVDMLTEDPITAGSGIRMIGSEGIRVIGQDNDKDMCAVFDTWIREIEPLKGYLLDTHMFAARVDALPAPLDPHDPFVALSVVLVEELTIQPNSNGCTVTVEQWLDFYEWTDRIRHARYNRWFRKTPMATLFFDELAAACELRLR
jgi:hypothetical protein